jgi:hypothetical protein
MRNFYRNKFRKEIVWDIFNEINPIEYFENEINEITGRNLMEEDCWESEDSE